jgi:hypothetical protein
MGRIISSYKLGKRQEEQIEQVRTIRSPAEYYYMYYMQQKALCRPAMATHGETEYSQIRLKWSPRGPKFSGRLRQMAV